MSTYRFPLRGKIGRGKILADMLFGGLYVRFQGQSGHRATR